MITLVVLLIILCFVVELIVAMAILAIPFLVIMFAYVHKQVPLYEKLYRELHVAERFPYPDDALKCLNRIGGFLLSHRRELSHIPEDMDSWETPSRWSDVSFFVRMCHGLGCEIVIRKVSDHDIEEDPDNPLYLDVREKVQKRKK